MKSKVLVSASLNLITFEIQEASKQHSVKHRAPDLLVSSLSARFLGISMIFEGFRPKPQDFLTFSAALRRCIEYSGPLCRDVHCRPITVTARSGSCTPFFLDQYRQKRSKKKEMCASEPQVARTASSVD